MVRRPWKRYAPSPERIEQLNKSLLLFEYSRKDALKISSFHFLILVATVVFIFGNHVTLFISTAGSW